MTNEKLYEAIGDISDRKVNEAKQVRKAKQANWAKWGAMAACLCVIAGLSIKAGLTSAPNDKVNIDFTNVEDYTTDENTTLCETPNWGISLSVKNVTSTGLTLIVKQSGGKATGFLKTGESYRLVAFVGETWKDAEVILDSYGWNAIAHNITVDGSTEFEIDWKWLYGELPSGKYRLVKEFMNLRKAGDYDTADFIVEFTIE